MDVLPKELLSKILVGVRVKDLLVFKAVCKQWCSLITDHHFQLSYLRNSIISPTPMILTILHQVSIDDEPSDSPPSDDLDLDLDVAALSPEFNSPTPDEVHFDFSLMPGGRSLGQIRKLSGIESLGKVVGSCNGIVCLCDHHDVYYLWNPSLNMYKTLPHMDPVIVASETTLYKMRFYTVADGLGYDPISDDYKIIVWHAEHRFVHVYSTQANSWKVLRAPFEIYESENHNAVTNVVVNGTFYLYIGHLLFTLDLHTEVFTRVPITVRTGTVLTRKSDLLDFEGSLAVIFGEPCSYGGKNYLWVLETVPDSGVFTWTRKFEIPPYHNLRIKGSFVND